MIIIAVLMLLQASIFYAGLYKKLLAPSSSTAAFEDSVASLCTWHADRNQDVLVFGDSRMYAGLNPSIASKASRTLRFLNAGIPGTSPRVWYFLDRTVDPEANRFRAIIIPVDSLKDDTSAIGSLDSNEHMSDLNYFLFHVRPGDVLGLAKSFEQPDQTNDLMLDLFLRGPILRPDFQSFLDDPIKRLSDLHVAKHNEYTPEAQHSFSTSLRGLRVNFKSAIISYPASVSIDERKNIADQVLRLPIPSLQYKTYRQRWLVPIIEHYLAAHVPVFLVRIPTRPVHRSNDNAPQGVIQSLLLSRKVTLLEPNSYTALERPALFADHDHLNDLGSTIFSAQLGHDVASYLSNMPLQSGQAQLMPFKIYPIESQSLVHKLKSLVGFSSPIRLQSVAYLVFLCVVFMMLIALKPFGITNVLLASSLYFYMRWNAWYVLMILFITLTDFVFGRFIALDSPYRRWFLFIGVALNVSALGALKYTNFVTTTLSGILGLKTDPLFISILVPIGISFHTFQSISYLVDVYRDPTLVEKRLQRYALYIAFFPQLLAGPIVRARAFLTELSGWHQPKMSDLGAGATQIALGLVKKTCIADRFASYSDTYFLNPHTHPGFYSSWAAAIAFTIQIYFDFSGYTDIAIGSARVLGFIFPINFRRPYLSVSISDFWRRWNITLSNWLRDYLYISLGGSWQGRFKTYTNLMITMLLGGLWHGANWTFVVWGGYQGTLLAIERRFGLMNHTELSTIRALRIIVTLLLVVFGWVLFRASSFDDASYAWSQMIWIPNISDNLIFWPLIFWPLIMVCLAMSLEILAEFYPATEVKFKRNCIWLVASNVFLWFALELFSWTGSSQSFVYFKF